MRTYTNQFKTDCLGNSRRLAAELQINSLPTIHGSDYLKSINLVATPVDGKHFGYTICEKAIIKILPTYPSKASIVSGATVVVKIGTATEKMQYQNFYIDTIDTDATSGEITLTCYDAMSKFNNYNWSSITITGSRTIRNIITFISTAVLSTSQFTFDGVNGSVDYTSTNINAEPNMTLRAVLEDICEITGTIAIIKDNKLNFISLKGQSSLLNINSNHYYNCTLGNTSTLTGIATDNGLGTTYIYGTNTNAQVLSNNIFVDLRESTVVEELLEAIGVKLLNIPITAYNMSWIGFNALEYGDSIKIDNAATYYLGENLTFDGGQKAECEWKADITQTTIENKNNDISTALRRTEVKVDKANQKIELVVEDTNPPSIKRAAIVASINEGTPGSSVLIEADQVDLQAANVVFTNNLTDGQTIISGDNIKTGSINADYISGGTLSGIALNIHNSGGTKSLVVTNQGETTITNASSISSNTVLIPNKGILGVGYVNLSDTATTTIYFKIDTVTQMGTNNRWLVHISAYKDMLRTIRTTVPANTTINTKVKFKQISCETITNEVDVSFTIPEGQSGAVNNTVVAAYSLWTPDASQMQSYTSKDDYEETALTSTKSIIPAGDGFHYVNIGSENHHWGAGFFSEEVHAENLPEHPTIAGNYNLRCTVDGSGNATYSWVIV